MGIEIQEGRLAASFPDRKAKRGSKVAELVAALL